MKAFGHEETESQRVVIVGGGNIGFALSKKIEEEDKEVSNKLSENKSIR